MSADFEQQDQADQDADQRGQHPDDPPAAAVVAVEEGDGQAGAEHVGGHRHQRQDGSLAGVGAERDAGDDEVARLVGGEDLGHPEEHEGVDVAGDQEQPERQHGRMA